MYNVEKNLSKYSENHQIIYINKKNPREKKIGKLESSNTAIIMNHWYFVTKIVLTYCEKKLF